MKVMSIPTVPPPSQEDNKQMPAIVGKPPVAAPPGIAPSTVRGANSISGEAPIFTYVNHTGNN
jgi:hypothetical protein